MEASKTAIQRKNASYEKGDESVVDAADAAKEAAAVAAEDYNEAY